MSKTRCSWCGDDPLYVEYHDKEWGVPVYDDKQLFEMLLLEGAQAGLSWITVLKKRENYRPAIFFHEKILSRSASKHFLPTAQRSLACDRFLFSLWL